MIYVTRRITSYLFIFRIDCGWSHIYRHTARHSLPRASRKSKRNNKYARFWFHNNRYEECNNILSDWISVGNIFEHSTHSPCCFNESNFSGRMKCIIIFVVWWKGKIGVCINFFWQCCISRNSYFARIYFFLISTSLILFFFLMLNKKISLFCKVIIKTYIVRYFICCVFFPRRKKYPFHTILIYL